MTCLVDLFSMNEFNRTEPLLHKLTIIWTLAIVQHSYGSIPGTVPCFPLVQRFQTGSASQPAPTRCVIKISQTPPEREASHPLSTRLKLIESVEVFLNAHTLHYAGVIVIQVRTGVNRVERNCVFLWPGRSV